VGRFAYKNTTPTLIYPNLSQLIPNFTEDVMASTRLVLFDIDGTLIIAGGLGRAAKARAMQAIFGTDGDVQTFPFGGKTDTQILNETLAPHGITPETIRATMPEYQTKFAHYMRELASQFEVQVLAGAMTLLEQMRAREDIVLGLVTGNATETAPIKLQAGGIDPTWFSVGAYGDESANRDDLPKLALQRANANRQEKIAPHDVWVIGDTVADIQCARAVGGRVVAVKTGFEDPAKLAQAKPDYLLDDLTQWSQVAFDAS
jgi:phosphoglycolate phosphatase